MLCDVSNRHELQFLFDSNISQRALALKSKSYYTTQQMEFEEDDNLETYAQVGNPSATTKVHTFEDDRTMKDLLAAYPTVECSLVEKVWNAQRDWGSCCDVLNSLIYSRGSAFTMHQFDALENASTTIAQKMGYDADLWPNLNDARLALGSAPDCPTELAPTGQKRNWSILEIGAALSNLTVYPNSILGPITQTAQHNTVVTIAKTDNDWQLLNYSNNEELAGERVSLSSNTTPSTRSTESYKDVLLKPCLTSNYDENENKNVCVSRPVKPLIPFSAVRTIKRVYQPRSKAYIGKVNSTTGQHTDESEDCIDISDVQLSVGYAKGSVARARFRSVAKIRPAQAEKRAARIAQKGVY